MSETDEEKQLRRQKRKEEKAVRLREKQEAALKKAHAEEDKHLKSRLGQKEPTMPNEMVKKGYTLTSDEALGKGVLSTLFKGEYNEKDIVIKVIEKEGKEELFLKTIIPRYIKILRILNERNRNIISTLEVFETANRVLIAIPFIPNGTLYEFLNKTNDPMDENQTKVWAQEAVQAMCYLHINGLVHRNLRAERILLDENNSLKITGLTYARLWINIEDNGTQLSNSSLGSGPYCAPESFAGEKYDPRTIDVWAYGVLLYYIWNKNYPFDYNQIPTLLTQQQNNEWTKNLRTDSNDLLKQLFAKIFNINTSQRPTIVDLLKDKWIGSKYTTSQSTVSSDSKSKESSGLKSKGSSDLKSKSNGSSNPKSKDSSDLKPKQSSDLKLNSNEKSGNKEEVKKKVVPKPENKKKEEKEENEDNDEDIEVFDVYDDSDEEEGNDTNEKTKSKDNDKKSNDNKVVEKKSNTKVDSKSNDFVIKIDILKELRKAFKTSDK